MRLADRTAIRTGSPRAAPGRIRPEGVEGRLVKVTENSVTDGIDGRIVQTAGSCTSLSRPRGCAERCPSAVSDQENTHGCGSRSAGDSFVYCRAAGVSS